MEVKRKKENILISSIHSSNYILSPSQHFFKYREDMNDKKCQHLYCLPLLTENNHIFLRHSLSSSILLHHNLFFLKVKKVPSFCKALLKTVKKKNQFYTVSFCMHILIPVLLVSPADLISCSFPIFSPLLKAKLRGGMHVLASLQHNDTIYVSNIHSIMSLPCSSPTPPLFA